MKLIPAWVRMIAFILGLFGIGVGIAGYFVPNAVIHGFLFDNVANHTMGMMFTGRNLACGIGMLLVAIGGVPESFALIFIIRFLIETQDLIANLANNGLLQEKIFVIVLLVLEAVIIVKLFNIIGAKKSSEK